MYWAIGERIVYLSLLTQYIRPATTVHVSRRSRPLWADAKRGGEEKRLFSLATRLTNRIKGLQRIYYILDF